MHNGIAVCPRILATRQQTNTANRLSLLDYEIFIVEKLSCRCSFSDETVYSCVRTCITITRLSLQVFKINILAIQNIK